MYPRAAEPADNHSLAGRVLVLGKKVSFNDSWFDSQGNEHISTRTTRRAARSTSDGERAFLVEAATGTRSSTSPPAREQLLILQQRLQVQVGPRFPEAGAPPVRLLKSPVPVKEVDNYNFVWDCALYWAQHNGQTGPISPGAAPSAGAPAGSSTRSRPSPHPTWSRVGAS